MIRRCLVSVLVGLAAFLFFLGSFLCGFDFGVRVSSFRSPVASSALECTCVPCLPDRWCRKCRHFSRDCPKLAWYFRRNVLTNGTNFVTRETSVLPH